jgi:hypothetical protein
MKTLDKSILSIFLIFIISYLSIITYIDFTIEYPTSSLDKSNFLLDTVTIEKFTETNFELLFDDMVNLKNYPLMIPDYIVSVDITKKIGNIEYATITTSIVETSFNVKHTIIPYQSHTIEVLDGDAKETIVEQIFEKQNNLIYIKTNADIRLEGFLKVIGFFSSSQFSKIGGLLIDNMIQYSIST